MKSQDERLSYLSAIYREVRSTRIHESQFLASSHDIAVEVPITVSVNGRETLVAMTSPVLLHEFVVGFLFTEGIISGPEEIESVRTGQHSVSVLTKNPFKMIRGKRTFLSGCGGFGAVTTPEKLPRISAPIHISSSTISSALTGLFPPEGEELPHATYIAGLFIGSTLLVRAEDTGSNHVIDRVIGYGLMKNFDFSKVFMVSSGRATSEAVQKCIMAGIPIAVFSGPTTTFSVEISDKAGLTLAGLAGGKQMFVYTHAERVIGA